MLSLMKFGGQTSKKVDDVRKIILETTLCVLACFIKLYVFVLDKIDMGGTKIVYDHIRYGNVCGKTPRTIQGSLRKDSCWWSNLPKAVPPTDGKRRLVASSTPHSWRESMGT